MLPDHEFLLAWAVTGRGAEASCGHELLQLLLQSVFVCVCVCVCVRALTCVGMHVCVIMHTQCASILARKHIHLKFAMLQHWHDTQHVGI
jgi:hypothetical protein